MRKIYLSIALVTCFVSSRAGQGRDGTDRSNIEESVYYQDEDYEVEGEE